MTRPDTTARQTAFFEKLSGLIPSLIQQYATSKAPHALMISGQFGVGKATLAGILAQALLCTGGQKPCGTCPECVKVQENNHANLLEVKLLDRQRSVKVDQARALLGSLATYPFSSGARVVLLHLADTYTPQAQNALLKAVEEPDPATFFLITCANEQAVLSTIRSRCQIFRLPPWPDELVQEALIFYGIMKSEAVELAELSDGSLGKALAIKDDAAFWNTKKLVDETILSFEKIEQLPAASKKLKDMKDKSDLILDYTQQAAQRLLKKKTLLKKDAARSRALLEGVFKARKQQASNLSWQAIIDCLLIESLEE
ncbi:MAG: hypothetical protein QM308_03025 [Bacillota bacterium]|nr:hypothetical protein [Bacillota bacterium]